MVAADLSGLDKYEIRQEKRDYSCTAGDGIFLDTARLIYSFIYLFK
jgi:hypothetical protein